ncbi:TetR/AcrR family transcriptional regulator [Amycolatopsis taiwanensis]|uniref:TetR family transcriptional regulator n=1 Tax=Amycolatopsis taiwanensis TaxID=342230 RepID=A0A9W6R7V2_9PSEU|nr:TetR/AcrR family transcriptional regulator [Amycolatopsis taiwanensis]GLY70984.1 TetR family transcriptional regulator [Amycolatopsis taiwanensis]
MSRSASGAPTGRPPRTSRAEILAAAHRVIDRDGWQNLTIRRLAAEVGASPATVYYHVRDKDDLLIHLLNDYADQIPRPELPVDPRERILAAATIMHDVLAARPWIVEVLAADDLLGESAVWLVEAILAGAVDSGSDPTQAVHLYRNIWYFTAGEILIRANSARRRAQHDRPAYRDQVFGRLDETDYPHLARLADRWPALTAEDTYAEGLRALVDGALPPRSG